MRLRSWLFIANLSLLFVLFSQSICFCQVLTREQILKKAIREKDFKKASAVAFDLGESFYDAKLISDSKRYLDAAIVYAKKSKQSGLELNPKFLKGLILFESKDYKDAINYLTQSSELALATNQDEIAFNSFLLTGKSHAALKRSRKSIDAVESALKISLNRKSTENQLTCYQLLQDYYTKSGNALKAEENRNHYEALLALRQKEESLQRAVAMEKQSSMQKLSEQKIVLAEQQQKIQAVEGELKVAEEIGEKRELEIKILSRDRELANLRIQEQSTRIENEALVRNSILIVLLLVTTLIGLIVINYRKQFKAKLKIELQNKNIRSSINYAKRIQEAMLPKKAVQEKFLPESFILFKPKDVVSGDFYWFSPIDGPEQLSGDLAIAAIDCTGHGVPGAFMSMVGINSLNSIIGRGITNANKILETLHQEIRTALQQDVTGNNDGMDAALCIYRRKDQVLEFAGAKNPLVYIKNNELFQVKGDIHSIGGSRSHHYVEFRQHEIKISEPIMVYLFSDGYRDQFGGPENQKFMGKRFSRLLLEIHNLPLEDQSKRLNDEFEKWKGTNEQTDDVLVIGLKLGGN